MSNHPFDKPFISFHCGLRMALRVRCRTSGVRDITYSSGNRTSIPQFLRFQHSTSLQHQFVICFPTPKATGQTMSSIIVARCLTMYGINVSCYTAILPLSLHDSSEEVSVPTRVPRHPSPLNTPAVTPTKVHLLFF